MIPPPVCQPEAGYEGTKPIDGLPPVGRTQVGG